MGQDRNPAAGSVIGAFLDLARAAAAEGQYDSVRALFHRAEEAGLVKGRERAWALLLVEAGAWEEASRLGPLPRFAGTTEEAAAEASSDRAGEDEFLRFEPAPRQREESAPGLPAGLVEGFLHWFAGRADVYARQWYDARNDRTGYVPVREPLTAKVAEQHLLGRITIGQYLLFPDDSVSFAVLDLDPSPAAWERMRIEEAGRPGALGLASLCDYALRIRAAAQERSIPVFLEDTGGAGLHVWLFFAPRISAKRARAVCRELLYRAGVQPPEVNVEVFPKQDHLTGKGLGNLVKLPLGLHQATIRRSEFLADDLTPLPAEAALSRLVAVPVESIDRLLEKRVLPFRPTVPPQAEGGEEVAPSRSNAAPDLGSPRALAEALAGISGIKEVQQAVDRVVEGCGVVRELLRRAMESESFSATAARALVYTIGLVGRENPIIDRALATAGVSRKELERVRRGFQSPLGCKKLKEWFPDVAKDCHCPGPPPSGYATPALFAFTEPPRFSREESVFVEDPEESAAELLLRHDPAVAAPAMAEMERKLDRIERILLRVADLLERRLAGGSSEEEER